MKTTPILFNQEMINAILEGRKTQTRRTKFLESVNCSPNEYRYDGAESKSIHYPDVHYFESLDKKGNPLEKYPPIKNRYGKKGDLLWVRETWRLVAWDFDDMSMKIEFKAGGALWCQIPSDEWIERQINQLEEKGYIRARTLGEEIDDSYNEEGKYFIMKELPWKPSIFMPKSAARIFLKITDVKVERLHDISESDAKKEGILLVEILPDGSEMYKHYELIKNEIGYAVDEIHSFQTLWQSINGIESWKSNPWVWVIEFERT